MMGRSTAPGPIIPIVVEKIQHQFLAIHTLLTCECTRAFQSIEVALCSPQPWELSVQKWDISHELRVHGYDRMTRKQAPRDRLHAAYGHNLLEHEAPLVGTERSVCLSLPHGGHRALRPLRVGEGRRRRRRRHPSEDKKKAKIKTNFSLFKAARAALLYTAFVDKRRHRTSIEQWHQVRANAGVHSCGGACV